MFYLGEDDLVLTNDTALVIRAIRRILADCSRVLVAGLELLQRGVLWGSFKPLAIKKARYNANMAIRRAVLRVGVGLYPIPPLPQYATSIQKQWGPPI